MERKRYLIALFFEVGFYFLIAFFGFGFDYLKNFNYKDFGLANIMLMCFIGGSAVVIIGTVLAILSPHLRFIALLGTLAQMVGEIYLFFKDPAFFKDVFGAMESLNVFFNVKAFAAYIALGILLLGQLTVVLSLLHVLHTIILPLTFAILSMVVLVFMIVCVANYYQAVDFGTVWNDVILVNIKKIAVILLAYPIFNLPLGFASDAYFAEKAYKTPRY